MTDCIFCRIASGEVESNIVYSDDDVVAFKDASPQMPVHVLVVPRKHYVNLNDDVPSDLLGKLLTAAHKVAQLTGIDATGYRILINNGDDAQQVVKHLHVHVLGGAPMNDGSPAR